MTDDDNNSTQTSHTTNRTLSPKDSNQEYILKFSFRPTSAQGNAEGATTHYDILKTIHQFFPEVQIYNNYGKNKNEFPKLLKYDAYLQHFKLQFVKSNHQKHRKAMYLV